MCHAISAAYSVDEVKDIRDKARAIKVYAKQAHNVEAERQACEIRLRAERKWAQLRDTEVAPQGRPEKTSCSTRFDLRRTLSDLGVSYDQSAKWQKLAEIPDEEFERAVRQPGASTSGIIAAYAEPKRDVVDPMALWLWGRLQDFERNGLLERAPSCAARCFSRACVSFANGRSGGLVERAA